MSRRRTHGQMSKMGFDYHLLCLATAGPIANELSQAPPVHSSLRFLQHRAEENCSQSVVLSRIGSHGQHTFAVTTALGPIGSRSNEHQQAFEEEKKKKEAGERVRFFFKYADPRPSPELSIIETIVLNTT